MRMIKKFTRLLLIAIVLASSLFVALPIEKAFATAPSLQEYWNTGGDGDSAAVYGVNWTAMQFTTGTTAHTATSIRLPLKRSGASPSYLTVSLRYATAGVPTGIDLGSVSFNANNITTSYAVSYTHLTLPTKRIV